MSENNLKLLSSAVQRQVHAVIGTGTGEDKREILVKFIGEVFDPDATGFWAHVQQGDQKLIDRLIKSGEEVSASIHTGGVKIFFESIIIKKRRQGLLQKHVLLKQPERASVLEQRSKPREYVPERFNLTAIMQVLSPEGEVLGESTAFLWDLGLDGASFVVPSLPYTDNLKRDASIKLCINRRDEGWSVGFLAHHRHLERLSDEQVRLGIEFDPAGGPTGRERERFNHLVQELREAGIRDNLLDALHQRDRDGGYRAAS